MGKFKNLSIELQQSRETNRHGLDDAHWDACINMAKDVEHWMYHHQLKMENEYLIKTETENERSNQSVLRVDTRSTKAKIN